MNINASRAIKAVLISLLAPTMAALLYATPTSTPPPVPTGVFYLPSQGSIDPNALNKLDVDGVVIGARWNDIEPNYRDFTHWGTLDAILTAVQPAGKPMRLEIATGGPDASPGPTVCPGKTPSTGNKPHWLIQMITANGGNFFTYYDSAATTATIPVFWDPTLLAEHAVLVQAVHDHILTNYPASYALLRVVFVPYANAQTDDWNLGNTSHQTDNLCNDSRTPEQRWLAILGGYPTMEAALIDAGNQTYNFYHTAFPDKLLTTSIGRLPNSILNPDAGQTGRNISETVVSTAQGNFPGFILAQKNNLNGGGVQPALPTPTPPEPPWNDLWRLHTMYNIPTAAQMVFHAYDDTTAGCSVPANTPGEHYSCSRMNYDGGPCADSTAMLDRAVDAGFTYATKWQEIYELDILNLGTPNADPHIPGVFPADAIHYAHQKLWVPPGH